MNIEPSLNENFVVNYFFSKNILNIEAKLSSNKNSIFYAFFLYQNKKLIDEYKYSSINSIDFTFSKMGIYSFKAYIRDRINDIRVSKSIKLGFLYCESLYYRNNKNNFINLNNKLMGEKFIFHKQIYFKGFNDFLFNKFTLFDSDPFENRTWRWNLLQLSLLNGILSVYNDDAKVEYLKLGVDLIKKWHEYSLNNNNNDLWHDHGTALRLSNITYFFSQLLKFNFIQYNDNVFNFLLNIIKKHINILKEDNFYSKFTNHGFDQSLILYQVSLELEYILDSEIVLNLSSSRILNEAKFAFCDDGGHKENSVGYLNFGIKQLISALNIDKSYNKEINKFYEISYIINKATRVLLHSVKPNGILPSIGDTPYFKVNNIFGFYKPDCYNEFLYAITSGQKGSSPIQKLFISPISGYAFYRSDWSKDSFNKAFYMSFKASYHSNYHRHDDDLSITMYAYGEDWLVDGGIYKYNEKNSNRIYIRSHHSHNVTSPLGIKRINRNSFHSTGIENFNLDQEDLFVQGFTNMYPGVEVRRKIIFFEDSVSIYDSLSSSIRQLYISRFFFEENKIINIVGDVIEVLGSKKKLILKIISSSPYRVVNSIKTYPEQGLLSKTNNSLYQSKFVEYYYDATQDLSVKFSFEFKDI